MGGTSVSILSPYTVERVQPIVSEAMDAEGLTRYEPGSEDWYSARGLPYGYDVQPPDTEIDPEELRYVEWLTGLSIRSEILVHIFVSDLVGRPVLARVAQRVAERAEGRVYVGFYGPPSEDLLDHLAAAGQCVQIDDDAVYLDAAAMAAWIAHPDFEVVR